MLYEQSMKPFSEEVFLNPPSDYRGTPFWSWNTMMTKEIIEKQIREFKRMGMGGFHAHVRVGLKNQYLCDEFMSLIAFANEKAKENGMLCWLYDEDRYSSGIAGGKVTQTVFYRARWLKLSTREDENMLPSYEEFRKKEQQNEKVPGCYLCSYDIVIRDRYLEKASVIGKDAEAEGTKWHLYLELAKETPWCNNQTYVDTMKKEAVASFIDITHERYAGTVGNDFGASVPAIFTDEPHINGLRLPGKADGHDDILLAYTEALPDAYGTAAGKTFFEAVPYIVWNGRGEDALMFRYHYYHTLSLMFSGAYCGQIGKWCENHNLLSTGHLLGEDSVRGSASIVGDPMLCYRAFQLPGIDNLCDNRDFSAAKTASSIARQYGKPGVLSEMYGVTQWDFDFKGYKTAGDWQAALGITVRVPHLAWASMNGEAKRDYPAAIGWQSPWYKDFFYIENHFARVNYCLTRGKALTHAAILHTCESFWLMNGPADQSGDIKKQMEDEFQDISLWLLTGGIDFDYLAESSIAEDHTGAEGKCFRCGNTEYGVIIVPSCVTLRETTVTKLNKFAACGGTVIFMGELPLYADCKKSALLDELIGKAEHLPLSRHRLLERMNEWREVDILENGQKRTRHLLHQYRADGDERWLFIAQAYNDMRARQEEVWYRRPLHTPEHLEIRVKGIWRVSVYDTVNGGTYDLQSKIQNGQTVICYDLYAQDSLMLRLRPMGNAPENVCAPHRNEYADCASTLEEPFAYRTDEPNVLVLDRFAFGLDGKQYHAPEEILKLDNILRRHLGWPMRCESLAQPYVRVKEEKREHVLYLKAEFSSEIVLKGCCLALEEAAYCTGTLNGTPIDMTPAGFYVDEALTKVMLPDIIPGVNVLELAMAYGDCTNPERMYILGEFGVRKCASRTCITEKPEKLYWGDYTQQGYPFYTGNMTYSVRLPDAAGSRRSVTVQLPRFSGAAVKARLNGGGEQMLAFAPGKARFENLKEKDNTLEITCLGNRYNGFGQLHMIGDDTVWLGPESWRTEGASWTDDYIVKTMGVLSAPLTDMCD